MRRTASVAGLTLALVFGTYALVCLGTCGQQPGIEPRVKGVVDQNGDKSLVPQHSVSPDSGGIGRVEAPTGIPSTSPARAIVRVQRAGGAPVVGVGLLIDRMPVGATDDAGEVVFEGRPGRFPVLVDASTVPPDLAPPMCQDTPSHQDADPPGFFAPFVTLLAGKESVLVIELAARSVIVGSVVDRAGVPVASCLVRLQAVGPGLSGASLDTRTAADGLFLFDGVAAGSYSLEPKTWGADVLHAPIVPSPLPTMVFVPAGARVVLDPFVAGDGAANIVGRLVGIDGRPVEGIDIVVYPEGFGLSSQLVRTQSDAGGVFRADLPAANVWVQVHPKGSMLPPGSNRRLKAPIDRILAACARGGAFDLGTILVPFVESLRIEWVVEQREDRIRAADPTLPERIPPAEVFVVATDLLSDRTKWRRVEDQGDGRYLHLCDAPGPDLTIVVERRNFPAAYRHVPGAPGRVEFTLQYP